MKKNFTPLSHSQQREQHNRNILVGAALELKLRQLVREATVDKNLQSATEFQQLIQYAPVETKDRILNYIFDMMNTGIVNS